MSDFNQQARRRLESLRDGTPKRTYGDLVAENRKLKDLLHHIRQEGGKVAFEMDRIAEMLSRYSKVDQLQLNEAAKRLRTVLLKDAT